LSATTEHGSVLTYPNFLDTLAAIRPMMLMRMIGGTLYLVGWFMMAWNLYRTIKGADPVNGTIEVSVAQVPAPDARMGVGGTFFNPPVVFSTLSTIFTCVWLFAHGAWQTAGMIGAIVSIAGAVLHFRAKGKSWADWYDRLWVNWAPFTVLTLIAVVAGGLIQIVPTIIVNKAANVEDRIQVPYTPLELAGRDIYVREGCYNCHSQMIRTLVPDILRYGDYSRLGESIYDHPFQWGSKRTGPDLARVGGKYPNLWHFRHMENPRSVSAGSNMPNYPWLYLNALDVSTLDRKIDVQRTLGVPYPLWTHDEIQKNLATQSASITADLRSNQVNVADDREIVAVIAYLQKLGKSEAAHPHVAQRKD